MAAFTLALGIGGSSAVFSLFRAVFLSPLPFPDDHRLVNIMERRGSSRNADIPVSGHEFIAWQEQNTVFDGMALFRREARTPDRRRGAGMIAVVRASGRFLPDKSAFNPPRTVLRPG